MPAQNRGVVVGDYNLQFHSVTSPIGNMAGIVSTDQPRDYMFERSGIPRAELTCGSLPTPLEARRPGILRARAVSSPCLFSGLLKCSLCGAASRLFPGALVSSRLLGRLRNSLSATPPASQWMLLFASAGAAQVRPALKTRVAKRRSAFITFTSAKHTRLH